MVSYVLARVAIVQNVSNTLTTIGSVRMISISHTFLTEFSVGCGYYPKTKYTCPTCGANAWAKPDAQLICGACYEEDHGEITLMTPEPAQDEQQEAA